MSKIDRLVGVKVFGWSIVTDSDGEPIWSNDCGTPLACQYASAPVRFGPNFTTEIAAAWEVIEHLRKQTKDDGTRKYLLAIIDEIAHVEVRIETVCLEDYHIWSGPHGQEPMGICVAALKACGVPESEIQEAMR